MTQQVDVHHILYSNIDTDHEMLHSHNQVNDVDSEPNRKPTSAEVTYAVVDKNKTRKCEEMRNNEDIHDNNCPPVSAYILEEGSTEINKTEKATEEMYAVVNKKMRKCQASEEEEAPPIPPYTLESLYTAVKKIPRADHQKDKDCKP